MIGNLLNPESLILIAVAALLLFGQNRSPRIGRSLGKAIREFHKATTMINALGRYPVLLPRPALAAEGRLLRRDRPAPHLCRPRIMVLG